MSNSFTLAHCCEFQEGYVNPTQKEPRYFGGNIKWLRASDLNDGFVFNTERCLSDAGYKSAGKSAKLFEKNTLAISKSGTIGSLGILKDRMCGNRAVINIAVNSDLADLMYVFYTLKYKKDELVGKAGGSIQKNLYVSALETLSLNHQQLHDQKKIAAVLSALDAKIDCNNRINAELEAMAKALYDYWFVQFDFPDAHGKPYKSSGGKMAYNATLKREIPEGWEVGTLGQWLSFKRGISYKSSEVGDEGVPLINLNSFYLDGSVKLSGTKRFSGKFRDDQRIEPGELVIAITDVTRNADIVGKAFVVPDLFGECPLMSCDVAAVSGGEVLPAYYLERLFNSEEYHRYIRHFASGTLVLHLNLSGVEWFETFLPSDWLVKKYCELAASARAKITENLKQNLELAQLRDWLLPLLMNGQVTVA